MDVKRKEIGQVEISFTFRRHLGPKLNHGAVKIQFDSLQPYSFISRAVWPENDNYEKYVRAGVEQALMEITSSLETTEVVLVEINFNKIDSTPIGFQSAAYAATCAAFLV